MPLILQTCDVGEGWVSAQEVDSLGLTAAMELAVGRALAALHAAPDEQIIMDGHINYCPVDYTNVLAVIDADATHPIVSAASIYAKVVRDVRMAELAKQFPDYGFDTHVGYGTAKHRFAITQHGITLQHRTSYKPIQVLIHEQNKSSGGA